MSTTQTLSEADRQQHIDDTAVFASMTWSGWGSPVGLAILIAAIGFFLLCLHWAGFVH